VRHRPSLAGWRVTVESALNYCCWHLITAIGMQALHPDRGAELVAPASYEDLRMVPKAARDIIMMRLQVMAAMFDEDVARLCGPDGQHNPERAGYRHGTEAGSVTLGGRRLPVARPRVRGRRRVRGVAPAQL
jgi:hypothetical protein